MQKECVIWEVFLELENKEHFLNLFFWNTSNYFFYIIWFVMKTLF